MLLIGTVDGGLNKVVPTANLLAWQEDAWSLPTGPLARSGAVHQLTRGSHCAIKKHRNCYSMAITVLSIDYKSIHVSCFLYQLMAFVLLSNSSNRFENVPGSGLA
jgi:hypothetical protein